MKIKVDKEMKIALLQAIAAGEIDTDIFPQQREATPMEFEYIAEEIVRLQKLDTDTLEEEADLMKQFARHEISSSQYVKELTALWQKSTKTTFDNGNR